MKHTLGKILCAGIVATVATSEAAVITLDFEGLQNNEPIQSFYNGGLGGFGSGPGPDYDLVWGSSALALIDADAGGSGNFGGEPSPDTIMYFLQASAVLDVPNGFTTGFSLYYTAISNPGLITVWDGPNATGNILAQLNLPLTPNNGAPDPSGAFSPLVPIGVAFSGTALSVDFGGTGNQIGYDNITFGSEIPTGEVPEVQHFAGMLGALMMGAQILRRRRA